MSAVVKRALSGFLSNFTAHSQHMPVRYRYYAERIEKGPTVKKFGYKEKLFERGVLPRLKDVGELPRPTYEPANAWSPEKVYEGQNDYIDLLGGGRLKPQNVCYNVPRWLRGKKGNEFQLLLLKHKVFRKTRYPYEYPTAWNNIQKRINFLYKFLNHKTKTGFMRR